MKKAFVNATIMPIEGDIIENGKLLIKDDKISAIGADIDIGDAEIIDCTGKFITPGLIDAHSHVGLFEEGAGPGPAYSDGNEISEATVPYLRVIDAIFPHDIGFEDARGAGVTTLGITHGSANAIGAQVTVVKTYKDKIVDDMIIKDIAGVKFAMGENPKRVGFNNKRAPQTRMGVAYTIRKAFYEALDYENEWEEYDQKLLTEDAKEEEERSYVKPPKYDLGKEILIQMMNGEIPARSHAHRADDIITAIRLSEEFGYPLIIDHATEAIKVKDVLAEKKLSCVIGPLMTSRSKRELVDRTLKTPGVMVKAGVLVAITTDAPVIPIHGLRDTVIMAVREGLPEDRALETVTINPAKILGLDNRIGSLKVGKDADFLIFSGDPLDGRSKVLSTYIDGHKVFSAE